MIPFESADQWRTKEQYHDFQTINFGGCEDFARAMQPLVPDSKLVKTEDYVCWDHTNDWCGGHCWLFDGKLHYDSEALNGVSDWRDLPFFKSRLEEYFESKCGCQLTTLSYIRYG